jgi:hypothetical protein
MNRRQGLSDVNEKETRIKIIYVFYYIVLGNGLIAVGVAMLDTQHDSVFSST